MRTKIVNGLLLATLAHAPMALADSSPIGFLDNIDLLSGSDEKESAEPAPDRPLNESDLKLVDEGGYGPSKDNPDDDPEPLTLSQETQAGASSESEKAKENQAKPIAQEDNAQDGDASSSKAARKEPTKQLKGFPVSKRDLGNANKRAIKPKQPEKKTKSTVNQIRRNLTITPGVLEVLPVSRVGHINRITTPFDEPLVKTTSGASISTVGPVVEVSTNTSDTVVVYISDQEQTPETTFGLALVPKNVPPLDVILKFDPLLAKNLSREGKMSAKARKWEESQAYVDSIVSAMKAIANQSVPRGYTFSEVSPGSATDLFRCRINGLDIHLKQRIDGHHFKVGVHKAINMLTVPIEVRESSCYRKGVVSVSAYPDVVLRPGESTELYIFQRSNVSAGKLSRSERPSVAGGSHGTH